jgi:hypothetical protein
MRLPTVRVMIYRARVYLKRNLRLADKPATRQPSQKSRESWDTAA